MKILSNADALRARFRGAKYEDGGPIKRVVTDKEIAALERDKQRAEEADALRKIGEALNEVVAKIATLSETNKAVALESVAALRLMTSGKSSGNAVFTVETRDEKGRVKTFSVRERS